MIPFLAGRGRTFTGPPSKPVNSTAGSSGDGAAVEAFRIEFNKLQDDVNNALKVKQFETIEEAKMLISSLDAKLRSLKSNYPEWTSREDSEIQCHVNNLRNIIGSEENVFNSIQYEMSKY